MFLTVVTFFIVLGVIVVVHEAGHFWAARKAGVKVDEFGLGIPPRIAGVYKDEAGKFKIVGPKFKETTKNTIWSLNWIPLGGFVKIKGESGEAAVEEDSFAHKKIWPRVIILTAGVVMNLILAVILFTVGFMVGVPQFMGEDTSLSKHAVVSEQKIQVVEVSKDSPAGEAGIEIRDSLVSINNEIFQDITVLQDYVDQNVGESLSVVVQRDGQNVTAEVIPVIAENSEKAAIGVALVETALVSYPWYIAPWYGFLEVINVVIGVLAGFFLLIKGFFVEGGMVGEVYGPVGIASLVGNAARLGFLYVVQFTAILSVIIAVINYLPFPALDGGRVLFLIIEAIRGKPVNPKIENLMHNAGFALLMLLVIIVTYKDIVRAVGGAAGAFGGLG